MKIEPPSITENTSGGERPFSRKRGRDLPSEEGESSVGGYDTSADDPPPQTKIKRVSKEVDLVMRLGRGSRTSMQNVGIKLPLGDVLATTRGHRSKALLTNLYRQALTKLKVQSGLTLNTARYARYLMNLRWPPMSLYINEIEDFTKKRGIKWMQIQSIDKVNRLDMKYMYLVGHMGGGKKICIKKTWAANSKDNMDILKEWLVELFGAK